MLTLKRFCQEEDGQDLMEYALLLAFVALTTAALIAGPMVSVNQIWVTGNTDLSLAVNTADS